jgi:DNA-binding transcriptional LysR family regulator
MSVEVRRHRRACFPTALPGPLRRLPPPALQDKLFELLPNWQTYGRTFFTVTPKSRLAAPRPRAFIEFLLASPLRPGM